MHAFLLFPAGPISKVVQSRKNISAKSLDFYSARLKSAVSVFPTGLAFLRLAHLRDIEASRAGTGTEKGDVLTREAVELLKEGLVRRPAGGYAWSRLAQLELSLGRKERGVFALKMSHDNALYDKRLALSRLHVGLKLYPLLGERLRGKVAPELFTAFDANPQDIVRLAWHDAEIPQTMQEIFRESPERLESFNRMYDPFSRLAEERPSGR